jgi:hypothetical protein
MTGYIQATMSHPTDVEVGREYSWYIAGEVVNDSVHNPALVYGFFAAEEEDAVVRLVRNDGSTKDLRMLERENIYKKGDQPEGTKIDTRDVYRGVIFTKPGRYLIVLATGSLKDEEAEAGEQYGEVFTLAEKGVAEFTSAVAKYLSVSEPVAPSLLGAVVPVAVPLAIIGVNEARKLWA